MLFSPPLETEPEGESHRSKRVSMAIAFHLPPRAGVLSTLATAAAVVAAATTPAAQANPRAADTIAGMDAKPRPGTPTDEQLLADHLAGAPGAFAQLVQRYRDDLHRFLQRFLNSEAAADDVFQETFLQIHLSAASFEVGRTVKPWLYTIAANKARDWHRKRKRQSMPSIDAPASAHSEGTLIDTLADTHESAVGAGTQRREDAAVVKAVVDAMPEHHREILLLAYFQKMPYQQIAEALELPLGTVKSRLHAAVATFSDGYRRATGLTKDE